LVSANAGVVMLGLITVMIIITSAAALHPKGIVVKSAAGMAIQFEVLFGSYTKYCSYIWFCLNYCYGLLYVHYTGVIYRKDIIIIFKIFI
jgi:hypothetical protein